MICLLRNPSLAFFLFISWIATAPTARADLIITGGSATVAPNGTGTVDFYVTSNSGSGDNLASIDNIALQIATASGTSFLQFSSSQPTFVTNSNYVFAGNSFIADNSLTFFGPPSTSGSGTPNDSISGGDFNDGNTGPGYTTVTSSTSFLLATVQFQTALGASPGDSFSISLVSGTSFSDNNGSSIGFTSTSASVTVESAGVPEPASLIVACISGVCCCVYARGRTKRTKEGVSVASSMGGPSCA